MTSGNDTDRVFENDGWDSRFRIGLLVPDGDAGPESEWSAMVPNGIVVNAARFGFRTVPPKKGEFKISTDPVEFVIAPGPLDTAIESLARVSAIDIFALGFTSNSYVGDDEELLERLLPLSKGRPVVTTGQAFLAAIAHFGARRVMLVDPPWFPEDLTDKGKKWLERNGLTVTAAAMAAIPSGQSNVHPGSLYRWLRGNIAPGTEMVLIGGNGFRAVGIVQAFEAVTGIPLVTANTALLWHSLCQIGYPTEAVTRYGKIFSQPGLR